MGFLVPPHGQHKSAHGDQFRLFRQWSMHTNGVTKPGTDSRGDVQLAHSRWINYYGRGFLVPPGPHIATLQRPCEPYRAREGTSERKVKSLCWAQAADARITGGRASQRHQASMFETSNSIGVCSGNGTEKLGGQDDAQSITSGSERGERGEPTAPRTHRMFRPPVRGTQHYFGVRSIRHGTVSILVQSQKDGQSGKRYSPAAAERPAYVRG